MLRRRGMQRLDCGFLCLLKPLHAHPEGCVLIHFLVDFWINFLTHFWVDSGLIPGWFPGRHPDVLRRRPTKPRTKACLPSVPLPGCGRWTCPTANTCVHLSACVSSCQRVCPPVNVRLSFMDVCVLLSTCVPSCECAALLCERAASLCEHVGPPVDVSFCACARPPLYACVLLWMRGSSCECMRPPVYARDLP